MVKSKEDFFKKKKVTAAFSVFAFISGFIFLNKELTGNVVLDKTPSFDLLPLMGILLVFCSAILALYTIKKR